MKLQFVERSGNGLNTHCSRRLEIGNCFFYDSAWWCFLHGFGTVLLRHWFGTMLSDMVWDSVSVAWIWDYVTMACLLVVTVTAFRISGVCVSAVHHLHVHVGPSAAENLVGLSARSWWLVRFHQHHHGPHVHHLVLSAIGTVCEWHAVVMFPTLFTITALCFLGACSKEGMTMYTISLARACFWSLLLNEAWARELS